MKRNHKGLLAGSGCIRRIGCWLVVLLWFAFPHPAGAETAVPDTVAAFSFDRILSSMNAVYLEKDACPEADVAVEGTLDYMAELFTSALDVPQILGGDADALSHMALPDGDVPINVSEFYPPVRGKLSSPFGFRKRFKRFHSGIDIALCTGDTVRAAFPGTVSLTRFDARGYGYYIILTHPNGLQTFYAHLDRFLVVPSASVEAGDPIAIGGMSGNSTGPHLHFETRYCARPINPAEIINPRTMKPRSATFIFNSNRHPASKKSGK